jgi:hypothetical protein
LSVPSKYPTNATFKAGANRFLGLSTQNLRARNQFPSIGTAFGVSELAQVRHAVNLLTKCCAWITVMFSVLRRPRKKYLFCSVDIVFTGHYKDMWIIPVLILCNRS